MFGPARPTPDQQARRGPREYIPTDTDTCLVSSRPCKGQHVSDPHVGVAASTGHTSEVSARDAPTVPLITRCARSRRPCERIGSSADHPSALGLRPDVPTGAATQVEVVDQDDPEPRQLGCAARALEAAHRGARLGNLFSSVANGRTGAGFV